jgi:hypothetical protein
MTKKKKYFWKTKNQYLKNVKLVDTLFGKELEGDWIDKSDGNKIKRAHIYDINQIEVRE